MTIFQQIIDREIPADIVYEDDQALAFRDISPQAPHHILIIPKCSISGIATANRDDLPTLGHLLFVASEVARQVGAAEDGYRLVINQGANGGQTVEHLHIHLLAGRSMSWPPG